MIEQDGVERPEPGAPPSAFRLWKIGKISTSKGEFTFTVESARLLLEAQERQGSVEYFFDYNHKLLDDDATPEARAAAGFHRLEMRGDELWIIKCRWTERAARLLTASEYKYFSPTFAASSTGEITSYYGCALTNVPATYDIQPIAASRNATPGVAPRAAAPRPHSVASVIGVIGAPVARALSSDPRENTEDRRRQRQEIDAMCGLGPDIQGWKR